MSARPRGVVVRRLARLVSNLVYREIDVWVDPGLVTGGRGGPTIAVANHFGGLADGVLLVDAFPVMPRIVARDVIWKIPVAGQLMTAIGGIPVHRAADGAKASNDVMFGSCYQALQQRDTILIFPEGVTQDVPHIAPVKTGAARIALGARASGVGGIRIVAVGVHYEDKAGFRSRVLVNAGPALDVDEWVRAHGFEGGAGNREAVDALTAEITSRLQDSAPNYPDWDTANAYAEAAEIPLHDVEDPDVPLRYGDVQLLAGQLHQQDQDGGLASAAADYRAALREARTWDETIARHGRRQGRSAAQSRWRDLVLSVLLMPYAVLGAVIGLVPWLLVQAVRLLPAAPAVRATITPGLAALAFGLEWLTTSWWVFEQAGASAGLYAFLLIPFFLAATVFVAERLSLLRQHVQSNRPPPEAALTDLADRRRRLADQVWDAL